MIQSKNILYYGKDKPLEKNIGIKAGPLNLFYEAGDLRYIKFKEKEIVRRVYVAVRDHNWDTVIPTISNIQINSSIDSFKIYSTPLKYPSPVEIKTGTKILQTFSLNLKNKIRYLFLPKKKKRLLFQ